MRAEKEEKKKLEIKFGAISRLRIRDRWIILKISPKAKKSYHANDFTSKKENLKIISMQTIILFGHLCMVNLY